MAVNVKDPQFGAVGDGSTDDASAIQRAVNYAKSLSVGGNGAVIYRATVYFPPGYYKLNTTINLTNTNGIYLQGDGGSYLNSIIVGNTNGPIFDFSGSSLSGCQNLTFLSAAGYGANRSTIGVLFALTSNGGLNCGIRNCYFEMQDYASANGGFGTIAVLDIRSEEFFMHECLIRANTPLVFSNTQNLSETGTNFTASSPFQTLQAGTGSMGVVNINGTSLQNYEKRQPAMVLVGTNSINFQGYISRITASNGTNETAIQCVRYTTNLQIHATIESFSRVVKATLGGFDGNKFSVVVANSAAPTTELVDVTACSVKGLNFQVNLPNNAERNRFVLYHAGDGTQQANGSLTNSTITCTDISDNRNVITANLLKRAENVTFNSDQPFEKKGGRIRQLFTNFITVGQTPTGTQTSILRFSLASSTTINNTNGGNYRIWVEGIVQAGSYGTQASATLAFQAQLLVTQSYNGVFSPTSVTVIILDRTSTNPAYVDIVNVAVDVTFVNGIGSVVLTPRTIGTSTGDPITYNGQAELQADFLVNDSPIFR